MALSCEVKEAGKVGSSALNNPDKTTLSFTLTIYPSAVKVNPFIGFQLNPILELTEVSCFKLGIPAAFVIASPLRAMRDCTNSPALKEVRVLLKLICCNEGALNPVLTDPLKLKLEVILYREANLKVAIEPKSA